MKNGRGNQTFVSTGLLLGGAAVFAGFGFTSKDFELSDFAAQAYKRRVPMRVDLKPTADGKALGFLIRARREVDIVNLDRVQIVKGWLDAAGQTHARVYDVAWSGDRKPRPIGKLPAAGNTVNVKEASYDNSIGTPYLATY